MNKKLLAILVIVLLTIGIIAAYLLSQSNTKKSNGNEYYDPNSGQTVSDPKGKAPDNYGVDPNKPIYLGITELLNYGVTQDQINDLKTAFYNYSQSLKNHIKEVSLKTSSIKKIPRDRESATMGDTITFDVIFDRKTTYQARFEYQTLDTGRLYLLSAGKVIYDSGNISAATD